MYNEAYRNQFSLLLRTLPCIKEIANFALKGGTAINLFYRDLPRVSVDIDLTYTKLEPRDATIHHMNAGLEKLETLIINRVPNTKIKRRYSKNQDYITKLNVFDGKSTVKIEPNFIFRGLVHDVDYLSLSQKVTQTFSQFIDDVPVASFNDVFSGKICAALNRQHPRDLFDIKLLLENEGLTDALRKTFVVYLACDARPMNELLNPNNLDITALYTREFQEMTTYPVSLQELVEARETLVTTLLHSFTESEKKFLLSVKLGEPEYSLLPFENLEELPALKWKLINVKKMEKKKHSLMVDKLKAALTN
jgi:predicted nucleotidyltransferase component of viral defense system